MTQPEVRLAFKIACCLAVDVTADLLNADFDGGKLADANQILSRYYRHPSRIVADGAFVDSFKKCLVQLYGVRWWMYADDDGNKLALPAA